MIESTNAELLKDVMTSLYSTIARRTSQNFALAIILTIKKALEPRYSFLKHVSFNHNNSDLEECVNVSSQVNSIEPFLVGRSIQAIVQVIYMDLKDKAGFYFINEFKKNTQKSTIDSLKQIGVDLSLLELQQHYLFRQQKRIKPEPNDKFKDLETKGEKSLLGYSWDNISNCEYDPQRRICIIYDKDGNELDKLELDKIVRRYLSKLTKEDEPEPNTDYKMKDKEKHINLNR